MKHKQRELLKAVALLALVQALMIICLATAIDQLPV